MTRRSFLPPTITVTQRTACRSWNGDPGRHPVRPLEPSRRNSLLRAGSPIRRIRCFPNARSPAGWRPLLTAEVRPASRTIASAAWLPGEKPFIQHVDLPMPQAAAPRRWSPFGVVIEHPASIRPCGSSVRSVTIPFSILPGRELTSVQRTPPPERIARNGCISLLLNPAANPTSGNRDQNVSSGM